MPAEASLATGQRRNGKAASCEPCRKAKIRCDHGRPICRRCQHRGMVSSCFYHPAPLTKARNTSLGASGPSPGERPTNAHSIEHFGPSSGRTLTTIPTTADERPVDNVVLQGLSRLSAAFRRHDTQDHLANQETISAVAEVLKHLQQLERMVEMLKLYSELSQACPTPSRLFIDAARSLRDTTSSMSWDNSEQITAELSHLASQMLSSTASKLPISSAVDTASKFVSLYTGSNLRLETIALIYSLTARTELVSRKSDDRGTDDFVPALMRSCALCLSLAREIAPEANDVMIFASFENMRLHMSYFGETHPVVWRLWGEFSTDIFALGIHRESIISTDVPFFLAETRRRTFTYAYQFDKFICTLFNRPPRILKRYTNCRLPLDLGDEELLGTPGEVEKACARLTEDGWNSQHIYRTPTWSRIRYVLGQFREDILEIPFQGLTIERGADLRAISQRCRDFWHNLPEHVRYTKDCWLPDGPETQTCMMLTTVYMTFLQTDFQAHQMLVQVDPDANSELLSIAAEIMTATLQQGAALDRAYTRQDISYQNLAYGFPAAVIIATALQKNQVLPSHLTRSTLIRGLSVLVSLLENTIRPGEANFNISIEAAKAISRTLDEILETPSNNLPTPATTETLHQPTSASQVYSPAVDPMAVDIADDVLFGEEGFDGFDLTEWAKNLDWPSLGSEWNTF